jgi:hypothetical protein
MSERFQSCNRVMQYLLQRLHKVGRSVCIRSALFLGLLLLDLDLSTLVADEFQDVIVIEDLGTGIEDLGRVSLCVPGRLWRTYLHVGQLRQDYATLRIGRLDQLATNSGPLSHVIASTI